MKTLAVAGAAFLTWITACVAAQPFAPQAGARVVRVDWQEPQALPRRLRNHCAHDLLSDRPYCSDHCGYQYQVYFCSRASFGCCRIGFGYCDQAGLLRCHP